MKKIPFAVQLGQLMKERGNYPEGYDAGPRGCIVHFTAGRYEKGLQSAKDCIHGGVGNGYTYLCIARTGEIVQAHDVNKWGYHAGESAWHIVAKKLKIYGSVSDDLIGIEMNNAGKLKLVKGFGYQSWFESWIPKEDVREVKDGDIYTMNGKDYKWGCPSGFYHKYSPDQEETLIKTIMWL